MTDHEAGVRLSEEEREAAWLAGVLAEHDLQPDRSRCSCGVWIEPGTEQVSSYRAHVHNTLAGAVVANWADRLAALTAERDELRATAWDEGRASVDADWMRGYDAQVAGEPCPDPTPNPYRAALGEDQP